MFRARELVASQHRRNSRTLLYYRLPAVTARASVIHGDPPVSGAPEVSEHKFLQLWELLRNCHFVQSRFVFETWQPVTRCTFPKMWYWQLFLLGTLYFSFVVHQRFTFAHLLSKSKHLNTFKSWISWKVCFVLAVLGSSQLYGRKCQI